MTSTTTPFPRDVRLVMRRPTASIDDLHPAERLFVRDAVIQRQREFASARVCAHQALSDLGIARRPLLATTERLPRWPSGTVGSISHCRWACGAAVARLGDCAAIGLDIETPEPMPERLWTAVASPTELGWITGAGEFAAGIRAKLLFSAKECVYKLQYPRHKQRLDFHDVEVEIDLPTRSFVAHLSSGTAGPDFQGLAGRFSLTPKLIVTGMVS